MNVGGSVVCEHVTLAQPDIALCGGEVILVTSDLQDSLDVAITIRLLIVKDLLATSIFLYRTFRNRISYKDTSVELTYALPTLRGVGDVRNP